jgi:hypothetical protein
MIDSELLTSREFHVKSETEFVDRLKSIFAHEKTRRVIDALIAQSQN